MRKILRPAVLVFCLMLAQILTFTAAHAAPGDFLFQWGAPQHFTRTGGVALDGNGNVYVTDAGRIQVFNSAGVRIRQWGSSGSGDGQFSNPRGIAVDGTGKVYVADTGNSRVQVFDCSGRFLLKWGHADWATRPPIAVASDGKGNVYVAEDSYRVDSTTVSGSVKVFDSTGKYLRQLGSIGTGEGQYSLPVGVTTDASGNVYVVSFDGNRIQVYSPAGSFIRTAVNLDEVDDTLRRFYYGLAVDENGNIYATQSVCCSDRPEPMVLVFDSAGTISRTLQYRDQRTTYEHYWQPVAVAVDAAGNVFTVDQYNDGVRAFDRSGNLLSQWWTYGIGVGQLSRPTWLAFDSGGNLYETDAHDFDTGIWNDRVQVFTNAGTPVAKWTGDFCQTAGISVDGGNVYVLDTTLESQVTCLPSKAAIVFDSSGNQLRTLGAPIPNQNLFGSAFDRTGKLLVTDTGNSNVRVYDKEGNLLTTFGSAGSGNGEFLNPEGITVDGTGNIFVVDTGNSRVQVFDSAYGFVRAFGGPGSGDGQFSQPSGIAVDGSGHAFVADAGNNRIQAFDSSGSFLLKWGSSGDGNGLFNNPRGVLVDKPGAKVYVADTKNNLIQVFEGFAAAGPFTISGTVRQGSVTGPVLAGAAVSIAGKTAYTSSTGTFCIKGIPSGTYTLTISRSGYITKTITGYEVKSDQSGLTFYLTRVTYSLSGTVRKGSATGPVLPGAIVSIAGRKATTASDGTFTVTGIPAGTYNLYISKSGYVTKTITGYVVNSNKSGLNFYLTPATYTVGGTIRQGSSSGPVLPGATVSIAGKSTTTNSSGLFSISGIPAGTYTLTISKTGYYTKTITGFTVYSNKTGLMYYLIRKY